MKKNLFIFFIVIISIFIMPGCTSEKKETKAKETKKVTKINKVETKKDEYIKYVQQLRKITESSEDLPFTIDIEYDKLDDEVRYQVIIDNPVSDITDIKALAIHDKQTDNIFPSVGIFDDKVSLIPNEKPSGVILVGYIPYDGEMDDFNVEIKVLISYKIDNEEKIVYYLTKK